MALRTAAAPNSDYPAELRRKFFVPGEICIGRCPDFFQVRYAYRLVGQPPRPKYTKMGEDMLRTNTRNRAKFHRCWPNVEREKRYQNLLRQSKLHYPNRTTVWWDNEVTASAKNRTLLACGKYQQCE